MADYVGRFWMRLSSALEFNTATLSGAIDVVVIEDERGRRLSSPFHVRFGKLQLLRTRGLPVTVELNGRPTSLRLYLGPAGEAYFYHPPDGDTAQCAGSTTSIAAGLSDAENGSHAGSVSSPNLPDVEIEPVSSHGGLDAHDPDALTRAGSMPDKTTVHERVMLARPRPSEDSGAGYASDSEVEVSRLEREGAAEVVLEPRSPPVTGADRRYLMTYPRSRELRDNHLNAAAQRAFSRNASASADTFHLKSGSAAPSSNETINPVCARSEVVEKCGQKGSLGSEIPVESSLISEETSQEDPSSSNTFDAKEAEARSIGQGVKSAPSVMTEKVEKAEDERLDVPEDKRLDSVTVSGNAENEAFVAEDSKLDVRSLDGYDEGEDSTERELESVPNLSRTSVDPARLTHSLSRLTNVVDSNSRDRLVPSVSSCKLSVPPITADGANESESPCVTMSKCGYFVKPDMEEDEIRRIVDKYRVPESEFSADPNILFSPDMLFCVDDRLVEFRIAAPFLMFKLAYGNILDIDLLSVKMMPPPSLSPLQNGTGSASAGSPVTQEPREPKKAPPKAAGGIGTWFGWSRASPEVVGEPLLSEEDWNLDEPELRSSFKGEEVAATVAQTSADVSALKPELQIQKNSEERVTGEEPDSSDGAAGRSGLADEQARHDREEAERANDNADDVPVLTSAEAFADAESEDQTDALTTNAIRETVSVPESPWSALDAAAMLEMENVYESETERLTLVPTSAQLAELDLQPGANTLRFVVESSLAEVSCRVFLWRSDAKIVVSDVDGTITRSDVLGHILPVVGRDWSHLGVANLYTEVARNGYKIMYLTARPIGQASQTRTFLQSVAQAGARLPNGPVLMSPNRLVESLTREVIRRKPQEFKIACLREIRSLFPMDYNPFHAGFGNRETDVISYRAVGMLPHRIFVVDTTSELAVNSVRYESASSYSSLMALVTSMFPDIRGKVGREHVRGVTDSAAFNAWNYWRPPLPEMDFDALLAE